MDRLNGSKRSTGGAGHLLHERQKILFGAPHGRVLKDPCPVFDGSRWHLYATELGPEGLGVAHAIAPTAAGPWDFRPVHLEGIAGAEVCAPGVVLDSSGVWHMFIQTCFSGLGGSIEHLISIDGETFAVTDTSLLSVPGGSEAGIYDPHPATINGEKYLVYAAMPRPKHADLHLAVSESGTWFGPWRRLGPILCHHEVEHHNAHDDPQYEWGLEGPQLVQLPDGSVLLIAVCFVPGLGRGERQRLFFAVADRPAGPFHTLGPVLPPRGEGWEVEENGHGGAVIMGHSLEVLYQGYSRSENWAVGYARYDLNLLTDATTRLVRGAVSQTG